MYDRRLSIKAPVKFYRERTESDRSSCPVQSSQQSTENIPIFFKEKHVRH